MIKQIQDFPDYYIEDNGTVYSDKSNKYKCSRGLIKLKGFVNKGGYKYIDLVDGSRHKRYAIHQLVAMNFVDGYFDGAVVDHKDNNTLNNNAYNLQWVTQRENIIKSYNTLGPTRNYYYYYLYNDNIKYGPFKSYNKLIEFVKNENIDTAIHSLQLYGHSRGWFIQKVSKEDYGK